MKRRRLLKNITLTCCSYFIGKFSLENALGRPTVKLLVGLCSEGDFITDTTIFEEFVNFQHDILHYFSSFDVREHPDMVTPYFTNIPLNIWNSGRIPFLSWYPLTSKLYPTPEDICKRIYTSQFDSYLSRCCVALLNFLKQARPHQILGSPKIYLRFAHEMNLNTSMYSSPTEFVKMWRYIYSYLRNHGLNKDKLLFIFCPNCTDVGTAPFEDFYPGDAYVNWNGIDGYNWGVNYWRSFSELFIPALKRMNKLSANPIAICEFGTTANTTIGFDVEKKAEWLNEAYAWLSSQNNLNHYNIKMVNYYNVSRENDIDSGIFIPINSVLNKEYFNHTYKEYMTIKLLNKYYLKKLIGFVNNNVQIDFNVFSGKF